MIGLGSDKNPRRLEQPKAVKEQSQVVLVMEYSNTHVAEGGISASLMWWVATATADPSTAEQGDSSHRFCLRPSRAATL